MTRSTRTAFGLLLTLALGACSADGRAFWEPAKHPVHAQVAPGVALTIAPIQGAPGDRAAVLAEAVAKELGGEIPAETAAKASQSLMLSGYASAANGASNTSVLVDWRMLDESGAVVGEFFNQQVLPKSFETDPWEAITSEVLAGIGRRSARKLVAIEATNVAAETARNAAGPASIPPPEPASKAIAKPVPRPAAPEIAEPSALPAKPAQIQAALKPAADPEPQDAAPAPPTPQPGFNTLRPGGETVGTAPVVQSSAAAGKLHFAVTGVTGAPGNGDSALAEAIRREMVASGATVSPVGAPGAIAISGTVNRDARGDVDHLEIIWSLAENNTELGQIVQENKVPAGTLDGVWGDEAIYAARSARSGILTLLARARK